MRNPAVGPISSEWSRDRRHPVTGKRQTHAGMDIAARAGSTVSAAFGGVVVSVREGSYPGDPYLWRGAKSGNHVLIRNPDGAHQYYGHLAIVRVREGDTVAEGQALGTVGATGIVTAAHLHFETWSSSDINSHFNPRILFARYGLTPGRDQETTITPLGGIEEMALSDEDVRRIAAGVWSHQITNKEGEPYRAEAYLVNDNRNIWQFVRDHRTMIATLRELAAAAGIDPAQLAAAIAAELADDVVSVDVNIRGMDQGAGK